MDKLSLSMENAKAINQLSPGNQLHAVGERLRNALSNGIGYREEERYFVAPWGSDDNDGLSWDTPFLTIQKGCNEARYIKGTTTIDSSKYHHKYVFVYPGVYNEQVLFSGYNIHLIGIMLNLGNVDYGVVINKDEAVTTTCVVGFTGVGIEIAGLQIRNAAAIPTLYAPTPGDGCWIHDNFIDGDDTNATNGIDLPDCRNNVVENNRIFNHVTTGILLGSNGTWFRNSIVRYNHIAGSQGKGIDVASGAICSAGYGSSIMSNTIIGTCSVGIHQQNAGAYILIGDNWVQASATVTDAGSGSADNHDAS